MFPVVDTALRVQVDYAKITDSLNLTKLIKCVCGVDGLSMSKIIIYSNLSVIFNSELTFCISLVCN